MNIALLGDQHITSQPPLKRVDDYDQTQFDKLEQELQIAAEEDCRYVLQAGDFFDSYNVGYQTVSKVISILNKYNRTILGCVGQHDISGHSLKTLYRSPLSVLEASGVWRLLIDGMEVDGVDIGFYGASFGEEVPKIKNKHKRNILVIHKMITDVQVPNLNSISAHDFLCIEGSQFDLTLCGDWHFAFQLQHTDGSWIVNPGCMLRKTTGERDLAHEPHILIYDTKKNTIKKRILDFKPVKQVFNFAQEKVKPKKDFSSFIQSLKDAGSFKAGWKNLLANVLKERKASKGVRNRLDSCMSDVLEEK